MPVYVDAIPIYVELYQKYRLKLYPPRGGSRKILSGGSSIRSGVGGSPDNVFFLVIKVLPIISLSNFMVKNWEPQQMGLVGTKPVFGVSDKMIFKPACSATETS